MTDNREALDNILKAINNIVEPTVKKLKYDKTFRGKVMSVLENGRYEIQVNGASYTLPYSGTLEVNDVVRVRVPLNNFSDAYIEPTGSSGGSSGGTTDYDELINRPYLNTNNSSSLTVNSSELLQNTISLHRVSKTGRYSDLIGTPSLDFIPNSQLGVAGGVATLDTNGVLDGGQLPSGVVIDASYVHTDNNFTTTLLNKLNGIENNAEVNVIESVAVNNSTLPISNKRVNITVPTQLSDLENDLSFATQNYVDTSVQGVENQIPTQTSQLQNNGEGTSPFLTSIPVASTTTLGGIKVGNNLSIEADGTLNAVGGGSGGTSNYNDLTNKPILSTNSSSSLPENGAETIMGTILLHKISKTGSYSDLNDIPSGIVIDDNYVHTDNNFTDTLLTKLNGIENGAQVNIIDSITVNGTQAPINNKTVALNVPTKTSDLTNDGSTGTPFISELPVASNTTLGAIKVGNNLTIAADGTLSASSGGGSTEVVGDTLPIGSIVEWMIDEVPENWLECTGQAVSREEYPDLFDIIGTKYGNGDGTTTFNLPNMQSRTTMGYNANDDNFNSVGGTGGSTSQTFVHTHTINEHTHTTASHTLTVSEIPSHTHTFTGTAHTHTLGNHYHSLTVRTDIASLSGTFVTRGMDTGDDNPILSTSGAFSVSRATWSGNHDSFAKVSQSNPMRNTVTLSDSHLHIVEGVTDPVTGNTGSATATGTNSSTGGGGGHSHGDTGATALTTNANSSSDTIDILPPYIIVKYIIKAKQTAPVEGLVVDNLTSTSTSDALSANQGRILNETKIGTENIVAGDNISVNVSGNNVTINSLGGGTDSLPVGVSMEWYTNTPPTNWLLCDGSFVQISDYPELFEVLGTTFGGNGTTDFALPNRKGRVGIGYDSNDTDFARIGRVGGSKEHTLTVSELATHTHIQNAHTHTQSAHTHTLNSHTHSFSATTSNRGAHTHTGRYLGMNVSSGGVGSYLLRRISDDDSYAGTSQITNSAGNHTHTVSGTTGGASGNTSSTTATNNSTTATNQNTGDSEPFSILNPYFVVNYIIKAK